MSRFITFTIASGAAVSDSPELLPGERILGIATPAAWTAADIYLQVSPDGGTTFIDINDAAGTTIKLATTIATAAAEFRFLSNVTAVGLTQGVRDIPIGPQKVRLRSVNTGSEADVNQSAQRLIRVLVG